MLEIKQLYVEVQGKQILKGLNLKLEPGKFYALMGPNGSGKSTLANVLMGDPKYKIISGEILFDGKPINDLEPNERAKLGIFLSFQNPIEVPGVTLSNFLRAAYSSLHGKISAFEFKKILEEKAKLLGADKDFFSRYLNQGFSGGEKKKSEILQLLTLNPELAILDETDSGLDIDSLKIIAKGLRKTITGKKTALVITHYKRILEHIKPDRVFVMIDGKITLEGDFSLVDKLEKEGYEVAGKESL